MSGLNEEAIVRSDRLANGENKKEGERGARAGQAHHTA
jgi:hypothetical protein